MEPEPILPADSSQFGKRIDGPSADSPCCPDNRERQITCLPQSLKQIVLNYTSAIDETEGAIKRLTTPQCLVLLFW